MENIQTTSADDNEYKVSIDEQTNFLISQTQWINTKINGLNQNATTNSNSSMIEEYAVNIDDSTSTATPIHIPQTVPIQQIKHIMISYNQATSSIVCQKIYDRLKERNYKVWFDKIDLHGDILDGMAEAVENAYILLLCMNDRYSESPFCRAENDQKLAELVRNQQDNFERAQQHFIDQDERLKAFICFQEKNNVDLRQSMENKEFDEENLIIVWLDDCHQNQINDLMEISHDLTDMINNIIDEFQQNYTSDTAIRWYTRDCFLYRLLNKALRYQDFDMLFQFRYIIKGLYEQLEHLYSQQLTILKPIKTVYRGQLMNKNELKNLQQSLGGLVSMNSFLSTTIDKIAALIFILGAVEGETVPVLFEININSDNSLSTPYANIQNASYIQDEEEILFSMDCVFEINSVSKCEEDNQIYLVQLTITNQYEENNGLKQLLSHIREKIGNQPSDIAAIGYLMMEMGYHDKAKYYYELLSKDLTPDHLFNGFSYNNIAVAYQRQGKYVEASKYFEKARQIQLHYLLEDFPITTKIDSNIGSLLVNQGKYDEALIDYKKVLNKQLKSLDENDSDIGVTYSRIAEVYQRQALNSYEKTLNSRLQSLPEDHPDIAVVYNRIAEVYKSQGKYIEALNTAEKALNIELKVLLGKLPDVARADIPAEDFQQAQDNYAQALDYCKAILEAQLISLPADHPNIAKTYNKFGFIHKRQGNYVQAMNYYIKTLDIQLKSLPENHPDLVQTYWNLGNLYSCHGNKVKAFEEWQTALNIATKILPSDHPWVIGLRKKLEPQQKNN
ncbi:hypothetical protein I4U23_005019 [Adineta vaga]|nr:hypothetical protein I4U23_005019 [Adineta vaga]